MQLTRRAKKGHLGTPKNKTLFKKTDKQNLDNIKLGETLRVKDSQVEKKGEL
jgi:hypothetical protein